MLARSEFSSGCKDVLSAPQFVWPLKVALSSNNPVPPCQTGLKYLRNKGNNIELATPAEARGACISKGLGCQTAPTYPIGRKGIFRGLSNYPDNRTHGHLIQKEKARERVPAHRCTR
jgi:hypothetical protein